MINNRGLFLLAHGKFATVVDLGGQVGQLAPFMIDHTGSLQKIFQSFNFLTVDITNILALQYLLFQISIATTHLKHECTVHIFLFYLQVHAGVYCGYT